MYREQMMRLIVTVSLSQISGTESTLPDSTITGIKALYKYIKLCKINILILVAAAFAKLHKRFFFLLP